MNVECIECGKVFDYNRGDESESENTEHICYGCALTSITGSNAPEFMDMNTALFVSGEMSKEDWREMQAELRRYHPDDFLTEEDKICERCGRDCSCAEERQGYIEWLREAPLRAAEAELNRLYDDALLEDEERMKIARLQAMYEESEALHQDMMEQAEQEWNNSFNPLLYNLFGWKRYNRFVAPILIRIHRYKQDLRR